MKKNLLHCIESVEEIIRNTPKLSCVLKESEKYLAHIDKTGTKAPELLEEHYDRVNNCFYKICSINGLDPIIDALIIDYVRSFFPKSDFQNTCLYIKQLFVRTVVYHDFGKVNENFQAHPDKMNNPLFSMTKNNPLKYYHSKLGAYLFVVKHFQEILFEQTFIAKGEEQRQMMITALLFSYSIIRHHANGLMIPDHNAIRFEKNEIDFLKNYLDCYIFRICPKISKDGMDSKHLKRHFFDFIYKNSKIKFGYTFYSLLRLNFSLLTTADYLATAGYSYGLTLESEQDWGVLSNEQLNRCIKAAENSRYYNKMAYQDFRAGIYHFKYPDQKSEDNLNLLRKEMAVNVLRQINNHKSKRLYYLEAPTGGGKTNLSMLVVAELLKANPELRKVFYVFPFTTLITQTHKSIRETLALNDEEIALLHSKIGFQTLQEKKDGINEEEKEDGFYGTKRRDFLQNLFALYPVLLVSHVRFFDILKSNAKEDIYLMHRLANSIVVLDELQAYNPKHWDKIMYLLDQYSKYFNMRFILMSATLPRLDKIKAVRSVAPDMPVAVDLLPEANKYFNNPNFSERVKFNFELIRNKEEVNELCLAKIVLEKSKQRAKLAKNEGRVFTIVEFIFKKTATAFKEAVDKLEKFFDHVFVLSGTILESRRREIIYFLKRNKETKNIKILLITTQVVEAGVDIDMDLGFKNVSLIDSDEQLAGRVNRNLGKEDCEVYLFKLNEPRVIYGNDYRYQIAVDFPALHEEVLKTKNFVKLYERVFAEIDKRNESSMLPNFKRDYLNYLEKLDFPSVARNFILIEQNTLSVFVPVVLPLTVKDEVGKMEPIFTDFELNFLRKYNVLKEDGSQVDGARVWGLYHQLMKNEEPDFISLKIERKAIQGVLSKFSFSIFDNDKIRESLAEYTNPELSFEKYLYLSDFERVYSIESGLMESKFNVPANTIL